MSLYNIYKYIINWNFYKGNQWIMNEDLEPFLKDDSGDVRNRIRWCYNIIRPFVRSLTGNSILNSYTVRAYNTSAYVVKQREEEKAKRLQAHKMMEGMPALKKSWSSKMNLGKTPQESLDNFSNDNIDIGEMQMNALFRRVERMSNFTMMDEEIVKNLALGGIATVKEEVINGEWCERVIDPTYTVIDTSATLPDLSDASFGGDLDLDDVTQTFEKWPGLTDSEREKIEHYAMAAQWLQSRFDFWTRLFGSMYGRVPMYNLYWHDTEPLKYGYIKDENGLTMSIIDHPNSKYTQKDIVRKSKLPAEKRIKEMQESGVHIKHKDIIRYISFIPAELVGENIVGEYGVYPYDEVYDEAPFVNKLPYKYATYDYRYGELLTPTDTIVDPQRMMNRYLSMMEGALNSMRGASYIYDKGIMADEDDGESEMKRKMNKSEPIGVDASRYGGNVQNAIVPYSNTDMLNAATGYTTILNNIKLMTENTTGVNQYMQGLGAGKKLAVGVQQSSIEQGTLMQQSFYARVANLYLDIYKNIANRGRKFYAKDSKIIYEMLHGSLQEFKFLKDNRYQNFHVELRRVPDSFTDIDQVNQMLFQLKQLDLIGDEQFATLFSRAELDQVSSAILEYTRSKQRLSDHMQQEQQQQKQEAQGQQQQERQDTFNMANSDKQFKLMEEHLKGANKIDAIKAKGDTDLAYQMLIAKSKENQNQE
jgi:hypothetical protein